MRWRTVVLAAGLLAPAGAGGDDRAADLGRLEGTWDVASVEAGGKKAAPGKGAPGRVVIKDGKATFFSGDKEVPTMRDLRLDLDPKAKPKAVDLVRGGKDSLPCIYEVTADTLRLAMPLVPAKRKAGEPL